MNFQDVIREVYDGDQKALKTTASLSASTIYVGNPTLYAVVNTAAAGDSVNNIGFATVSVSNPTLYAVVNTSAAGVGNSIVTVANTPLQTRQIGNVTIDSGNISLKGNVTLSGPVPTGANWVGLMTVHTANAQINTGNVTLNPSSNFIGIVTIANPSTSTTGNVTLDAGSKTQIVGNVTLSGPLPTGLNNIGFATVAVSTPTIYAVVNTGGANTGNITLNPGPSQIGSVTVSNTARSIVGNITLSDPKGFIGLVTIVGSLSAAAGNVTLDDGSLVGLVAGVNNIGFATVSVSNPTIYAVVNTSASSGFATVDIRNTINSNVSLSNSISNIGFATVSVSNAVGNATLNPSPNYIGLVTATPGAAWTDPKTYIGLVTITGSLAAAAGNVTLDDGSLTGLVAGINSIGFATVHLGTPTIYAVVNTGAAGGGNVTLDDGSLTGLVAGVNSIGFATVHQGGTWTVTQASAARTITGNITLSDAKTYIGLVTVTQASSSRSLVGNVTLSDSKTFIGLVTSVPSNTARSIVGNLTVLNAGTSKTLIPMPFGFALTSVATVAVPTNTFKITNLLVSSNATVGVSIKSGATYIVGNASIRVSLAPNGGWVENGSPDSPVYVGLAGAAAIVVEKNDITSAVAGKVIYFDE